ncbi:uncharacterized protein PODANS_6_7563 [Podospora anserina S mat+]|uniref:Podospora anserina S mat+ genomic DNA chromosome 6, supercontig 2 n=1 Tax=Podospora anserina (strain S / ATCC MYA-4624 / DSM 980 / FGSC 10383) TaxID=515849 RepID=B2B3X7_PODAN|nr:uncharacterized protein PODANS_6_7563 [Podospora anserina S mat+]CAP71813.1 unnamed protein product [Podospora anserina S mat+]CDP31204.1 Putative protein of unknown function [Podospora anserina S mat+]
MAPQLRRLLPNKGLSWSQGDVVLGKTRRDRSVVDTLARVMPLDKQNVRGFLLKMVEFALGMGRWLVEQHEESCAPPETVVEIDPFWVFQEMHMHFTHEMGWENEMDYALFISLFQELMYARERYRNWWDSTPRTSTMQGNGLTDGLDKLYFEVPFFARNELEVNLWVSARLRQDERKEGEAAAFDSVADGLQALGVNPAAPPRVDFEDVRQALKDMDFDETMEDAEVEGEGKGDGMEMEMDRMDMEE